MCGGMRKCRKIFKGGGKQKKSGIVGEMSKVDKSTRMLGVQQRWKRLRVSCMSGWALRNEKIIFIDYLDKKIKLERMCSTLS